MCLGIWGRIWRVLPRLIINLTHGPDNELTSLKAELRSNCEKYSKINVPYKYKKVIDNLSKNKNEILKQDKARGVVILDITKYTEKCVTLLNTEGFKRVTTDPDAAIEKKLENAFRKIKSKVLRAGIQKIIPNRLSNNSILRFSQDTQVKKR